MPPFFEWGVSLMVKPLTILYAVWAGGREEQITVFSVHASSDHRELYPERNTWAISCHMFLI